MATRKLHDGTRRKRVVRPRGIMGTYKQVSEEVEVLQRMFPDVTFRMPVFAKASDKPMNICIGFSLKDGEPFPLELAMAFGWLRVAYKNVGYGTISGDWP